MAQNFVSHVAIRVVVVFVVVHCYSHPFVVSADLMICKICNCVQSSCMYDTPCPPSYSLLFQVDDLLRNCHTLGLDCLFVVLVAKLIVVVEILIANFVAEELAV